MKLLFIHDHKFVYDHTTNSYYDGSGGAFGPKLWNRYLSFSHHLTCIGRKADKLPNQLVISSCENVTFSLIDDINSYKDIFTKKRIITEKIKKSIDEVDFVVIRLPSTLGHIAQSICISENKPYIIEIVGCPWDSFINYAFLTKLLAPYAWYKLRKSTLRSKACIYVTKYFLQKRYPTFGKSVAISNINIEQTISFTEANNFYSQYKNSTNTIFKIAYIGTFHTKYKGHDILFKALRKIIRQDEIPNIRLYLVGTGDPIWIQKMAKKMGIEKNIEVVGMLKSGEDGVIPFLDTMHLYVHPSRTEGLPRTVLEAMSRGRLTLGSNVGGIPELLNEKYLHKSGDVNKLFSDIISIHRDQSNWENIIRDNIHKAQDYLEIKLHEIRKNLFLEQFKQQK